MSIFKRPTVLTLVLPVDLKGYLFVKIKGAVDKKYS